MKQILFKLKGMITVKCIVSGKNVTKTYIGHAQIKKAENTKDLFNRAINDTIYQHAYFLGDLRNYRIAYDIPSTSYQVNVIDYKMKYLGEKDLIKIKRITRKGKYYNQVTDRRTGKIITSKKWGYERNLSQFE